jgi:hypothetical protein
VEQEVPRPVLRELENADLDDSTANLRQGTVSPLSFQLGDSANSQRKDSASSKVLKKKNHSHELPRRFRQRPGLKPFGFVDTVTRDLKFAAILATKSLQHPSTSPIE